MEMTDLSPAGAAYVGYTLAAVIERDGTAGPADLRFAIEHASRYVGSTAADVEFIKQMAKGSGDG